MTTTRDWKKFKEDEDAKMEAVELEEEDTLSKEKKETEALMNPSIQALEEQLTLAEKKAHEHWEEAMRAKAMAQNMQRRAELDVKEANLYGKQKLIIDLLAVIDSLAQALELSDKALHGSMVEGLELTLKLFLDVLEKHGVKAIEPLGLLFDPHEHEAMSMQVNETVPANTVLAVFQKGYKLHDRVIRAAKVVVSRESSS